MNGSVFKPGHLEETGFQIAHKLPTESINLISQNKQSVYVMTTTLTLCFFFMLRLAPLFTQNVMFQEMEDMLNTLRRTGTLPTVAGVRFASVSLYWLFCFRSTEKKAEGTTRAGQN